MDFVLRQWKQADADSVARYINNKNVQRWLRDGLPFPYTREDAVSFIEDMCLAADPKRDIMLAVEAGGEAIGSIGVFTKDNIYCKSAELGYWLAEPFWRRGIMTRAVQKICTLAFETLDIVRIFAEPFAENAGSRKVLENTGFVLEGILRRSVYKEGRVQDSCMYALLK
ncbi:GNAT family N-acetyltransferase [Christensenella timonensis]|uniref:GNAT family N-acetyltransferase n=1 Tax=Christensenella timonensis TaxID=1816678 RepID=UPI00082CAE64|nr:GNAT family N-acetyltransferase [Christensenella timonensis]